MVDWLLDRGADPTIRDTKVHTTPDGWAAHAHHPQLADHLRKLRDQSLSEKETKHVGK
jgi:hypothetical protein